MAKAAYILVTFEDAGPFKNQRRYRLATDATDDLSNAAAVLTNMNACLTNLTILSWDGITDCTLEIGYPQAGVAAEEANNNVEAFMRCTDSVTGKKTHVSIPAWNDTVFDKASNGLLSAAWGVAAGIFVALIKEPETGNALNLEFSQSRGIKRGQRLVK